MPYGAPSLARQPEQGRFNRFLASLPPHDFSRLAPHLHTIALERGATLHDVGEEIEHVYFPHTGMISLVAVMQSGATVETAAIGRAGVIGASAGLGARSLLRPILTTREFVRFLIHQALGAYAVCCAVFRPALSRMCFRCRPRSH